ncbi:MAG: hypothetical protein GY696_14330, partial [Gammaproteobacteria bacterium]|nr:hypothetical protein [Gammaproteobacteria bacterium]
MADLDSQIRTAEEKMRALALGFEEHVKEVERLNKSLNDSTGMEKLNGCIVSVEHKLKAFNQNLGTLSEVGNHEDFTLVSRKNRGTKPGHLEQAISQALSKNKEKEICDRCLVVDGLIEPTSDDGTAVPEPEMMKYDESAIKQAFKAVGLGYLVPEKVYRLKPNRNAPTSHP